MSISPVLRDLARQERACALQQADQVVRCAKEINNDLLSDWMGIGAVHAIAAHTLDMLADDPADDLTVELVAKRFRLAANMAAPATIEEALWHRLAEVAEREMQFMEGEA